MYFLSLNFYFLISLLPGIHIYHPLSFPALYDAKDGDDVVVPAADEYSKLMVTVIFFFVCGYHMLVNYFDYDQDNAKYVEGESGLVAGNFVEDVVVLRLEVSRLLEMFFVVDSFVEKPNDNAM